MPHVGWANAVPDPQATVDFEIGGTTLAFSGAGYHDNVRAIDLNSRPLSHTQPFPESNNVVKSSRRRRCNELGEGVRSLIPNNIDGGDPASALQRFTAMVIMALTRDDELSVLECLVTE